MSRIGGVIVAAGRSTRMGQFKPLMELGGRPVIDRVLDTLEAAGADPLVVVTGYRADELAAHLAGRGVELVHNSRFAETDMFRSACLGLEALAGRVERCLFTPVDVPLFSAGTAAALGARMDAGGVQIVQPTHLGKAGHPVLLEAGVIPRLLDYGGDRGLKGAMAAAGAEIGRVAVRDRGAVMDADTPEAFRLLALLADPAVPVHIRRHMEATAVLAVGFAQALCRRGRTLDVMGLELAALLHDVALLEPRHWDRGAELLLEAGRPDLARMVKNHMDPEPGEREAITETTLLFLADKYIQEDRLVPLTTRYEKALALETGPNRDHAWGNYQLARRLTVMLEGALDTRLTMERLEEMANADTVYGDGPAV